MKRIKKSGYLWQFYGFTMTHMWGLHFVSGFLGIAGVGIMTFALIGINHLEQDLFYRLIASSVAVLIADLAVIAYSIFTILFYRFSGDAILERATRDVTDAAGDEGHCGADRR